MGIILSYSFLCRPFTSRSHPPIAKQLVDKMYERRKAAALDLEKYADRLATFLFTHLRTTELFFICRLVRECHQQGDDRRIGQIVDQLSDMFSSITNALHVRNGGLIGLAGTAIALGADIAPYMERFLEPLLVCFSDPENRVRYFAAECLYNIAKVSKGGVLVYFNPIFDALSKVSSSILFDVRPYISFSSLRTRSSLSRTAQSSWTAYSKI